MTPSENPPPGIAFRAELRRARIAARQTLDQATHARHSAAIDGSLAELLTPRPPSVLAFCWPIRAEFDCRPLARRLLAKGWRTCMPVVIEADAAMIFRAWTPQSAMALDRHGIPVPEDGETLIPDVLLLPLVAFDARGFRLGYGGGYFDRTLAGMVPRPFTVGVGFELARVDSIRPATHDIALDAAVTEAGIVRFPAAGA